MRTLQSLSCKTRRTCWRRQRDLEYWELSSILYQGGRKINSPELINLKLHPPGCLPQSQVSMMEWWTDDENGSSSSFFSLSLDSSFFWVPGQSAESSEDEEVRRRFGTDNKFTLCAYKVSLSHTHTGTWIGGLVSVEDDLLIFNHLVPHLTQSFGGERTLVEKTNNLRHTIQHDNTSYYLFVSFHPITRSWSIVGISEVVYEEEGRVRHKLNTLSHLVVERK